jgi:FKBP-type peptidyl-prolyl cis-trans isomerase
MPKEPIIEDIQMGEGRHAAHRDIVKVRLSVQLAKGEQIMDGEISVFQIGARNIIAGLEKGVVGMKQGGERKISFGPHLGYGDKPVGHIPAHAKLVCHVSLLELYGEDDPDGPVGIRRMTRRSK